MIIIQLQLKDPCSLARWLVGGVKTMISSPEVTGKAIGGVLCQGG